LSSKPLGKVVCHDKTPFCDYQCEGCGFVMHIHKSQVPKNYQETELWTFCKSCGAELTFTQPVEWTGEG